MKKFFLLVFILFSSIYLSGCATIVGSSTENFSINSEPSQADIKIIDIKSNIVVSESKTPLTIVLEKSNGYFAGKSYKVTLSKPKYKDFSFQIRPKANSWYIAGNLIFGGFPGWLVVDPITGSMWTLTPDKSDQISSDANVLKIKLLSDLTMKQKAKLIKVNEKILYIFLYIIDDI